MWMNMQKQKANVELWQKALHNLLLEYSRRRIRDTECFYSSNLNELLEYVRSPTLFHKTFRVTLPAFLELKNLLYDDDAGHIKYIPEIDLLVFLFWLSDGASYEKVSEFLNVPVSTLQDKTDEILQKFASKMSHVIRFPKENICEIGKNFQKIAACHAFGLVIGCLDAYHVRIQPTSRINKTEFLNSENELSVQVQVVCDHKGSIMSLDVGFPGSWTKLQILQQTPLYLNNTVPDGHILLAGIDYPCLLQPVCVLPPYALCDNILKERFNEHLCKANSVLTYSVGQLFARWRRLFSKPLNLSLSVITKTIIACSVIQNISMQKGDPWPEEEPVVFLCDKFKQNEIDDLVSGEKTRKQISELIVFDDEVKEIACDYTVYKM
ncbi:uncharacterized protein LOC129226089 isoform X2 [Uloborus diversus]|nr:uncharacterized protein LOC129226089 isoform X2 [Uloborus diversus]